jgi:hypothetical protein
LRVQARATLRVIWFVQPASIWAWKTAAAGEQG